MGDDDFFTAPPADAPPPAEGDDGDFFGSAPAPAGESYLGDVNETDTGFAALPPSENEFEALPPSDDAPIILGGHPPSEAEAALDDEQEAALAAPVSSLPSAMQKWNEEWQETLKARKDQENAKKAELLEKARVDLENFQKERESKREAKMAKNREDEQAKLEAIEADLENDNSWQRVCKMVELTHDSTEAAEDAKRMRDVLIYLKNDTSRAEVLGS